MPPPLNLQGKVFGRLTALERTIRKDKTGNLFWKCKCICSKIVFVIGRSLVNGNTKSCGCIFTTHGLSKTAEYKIWERMRSRCNNKNDSSYKYYGGRGIYVDQRWNSFEQFYKDMGLKPDRDYSLERIDNDGPYSSKNCTWIKGYLQNRNKRNTIYV